MSFSKFFTKVDFDYDDPNIDLYKFHPQIRIFLIFNGIFFNNTDSKVRYIWPVISFLLSMIAVSFELIFVYHGYAIKDYSFATECFTYFIALLVIPVVYASVFYAKSEIINLLNNMNTDFIYICSLGPKYKDTFLRGQQLIWKLCIMWFVLVFFVEILYFMSALCALFYQSLFATQTEYMVRPLIFPMWLPEDDPYRTPNYEIFLSYQLLFFVIYPLTFCGLDETVALLPRYDSRRVEVQTTLNKRMQRIIEWHVAVFKSVEAVSSVYGPPIVYQVMFSSLAICLMLYQVAESLDHGELNYKFAALCFATCVQLWIPCYLGTLIRNKAFSVSDAFWQCGWHETSLGCLIRQDVIIVILRAQQPVSIKFIGVPKLELETFSSIMSTSYSYFNLLRQYK